MDKRIEANLKVKKKITDALFNLMEEKKFEDIKINEIVKKAGVARSSYYRNFRSKEDILYNFGYKLHEQYIKELKLELNLDSINYENILYTFKYYLKNKKYLIKLINNGFSYIFLELLNEFVSEEVGDMSINSVERYKIYCYTGAIFNISIKWIEEGMKETPEEMAKVFISFMK